MDGRPLDGGMLVSTSVCHLTRSQVGFKLTSGSISTANGSSLVRMGETTMVCGIKAEVAEPNIATPEEGFVGESASYHLIMSKLTSSA